LSQENLLDSLLRFNKVATKQEIPISSKDEIPPSEITPSQIPNSRLEFGLMLESFKLKSMIEIGVQQGLFADAVLSKWPSFQNYYGIDAWTQQTNYIDQANVPIDQQEIKYKQTLNLLSKYGEKIKLIRNYSTKAIQLFKDKTIDFIYVDAIHDYCGCYEDLTLYYPKLKCNGIMAGHDYVTAQKENSKDDWGVCENGTRILLNGGSVKGKTLKFANF